MTVSIKRAYEAPAASDGYRVLVDRLWPRGIRKEEARIDEWAKEIAPTDALRKWFHQHESQWPGFRERYLAELKDKSDQVAPLIARAGKGRVTLVYSSKNEERNNATVLQEYIEERLAVGEG